MSDEQPQTLATELRAAQARIAQLEAQLAAAQAKTELADELESVVNAFPIRIFWKDRESRFLGANQAFAKDAHVDSPQVLIGKTDADFFGENLEEYVRLDRQVIDSGKPMLNHETHELGENGQMTWVSTSKYPLFNKDSAVIGVLGMYINVDEQKIREQALKDALRRSADVIELSAALNRVNDGEELLKTLSRYSFTNAFGSLALLHFDLNAKGEPEWMTVISSLRGENTKTLVTPLGTRFFLPEFPISRLYLDNPLQAVVVGDVQTDGRLDAGARAIFGSLDILSFIIIPLSFGEHWIGQVLINFDHTRIWTDDERELLHGLPALMTPIVYNLRLLQSLEESVSELNSALIFKDQFLAIMSHELRTPLNAILGYSSIGVTMENVPPKLTHMLERIVANSERLHHLINEVLDLSRINAGRFEIMATPVDLHQMARGWAYDFKKRAEASHLGFEFTLDESLPQVIVGDEERITQIINNLLENALKFTEEGTISLTLKRVNDQHLAIIVRDTGIGISPTWHHLIFEEFRRVEMNSIRKTGGAGLGLSIVQRLCKMMGGSISVESELDKGSTFTVMLPIVVDRAPT